MSWTTTTPFDHKIFEDGASWYSCPEGEVIGGFYKNGNCQALHCIENMRCVKPITGISGSTIDQSCYIKDITQEFDNRGTGVNVEARCDDQGTDDYFIRGIYQSDNHNKQCTLHCWEKLECCQYDPDVIIVSNNETRQDWWSCFDSNAGTGWCDVDNGDFITGLVRTDDLQNGNSVHELEEAITRQIYLTATGMYYKYLQIQQN